MSIVADSRLLVLSLVLASLGHWACAHEEAAPSPARANPLLAEQGETDFQRYCSACHGLGGRGDGPAAAALLEPPADLTRIAERRGGVFPDAEITRHIDGRFVLPAHGSREMPVWGVHLGGPIVPSEYREEVVRGRLLNLIEYLKSIQRSAGSSR